MTSYKDQLPIYEDMIHNIRSAQHEYANRLQALQHLADVCDTYESLRAALTKYTENYSHSLHAYPLLQINMPLLAAGLYHLSLRAEARQITVQFDISGTEMKSGAQEYEYADMASILLQNAIEACHAGDWIYVHMQSENGKLDFEVRNPADRRIPHEEISLFFKKNHSNKNPESRIKAASRGYGLYELKKKILQLHGEVHASSVEYEGRYYTIFRIIV